MAVGVAANSAFLAITESMIPAVSETVLGKIN